jgi:hypothetical protein
MNQQATTHQKLSLFFCFKCGVYAALLVLCYAFFITEPSLSEFWDSAGWLVLLGVLEYESSVPHWHHRRWLIALNALGYGIVCIALAGYIAERDMLDIINCSAWLGVCALLTAELYATRHIPYLRAVKYGLYAIIIGCALCWSWWAHNVLEAIDAWLWLICFFVIEANIKKQCHPNFLVAKKI